MTHDRHPIHAVLFDWDGTLLDSYHADTQAYLAMFQALGINWGTEELERHYSPNWLRVYRAARLPQARWDEADRLWQRFYRRQKSALLPGARKVVHQLAKRFTLGLVSSGDRSRVLRQLREFRMTGYFAARVCSQDARHRKPHPEPLRLALRHLRLEPAVCVYVGDTAEDIEMARRAQVRSIGMLGPFPTHRRLRAERPNGLISAIAELPGALQMLESSATWA